MKIKSNLPEKAHQRLEQIMWACTDVPIRFSFFKNYIDGEFDEIISYKLLSAKVTDVIEVDYDSEVLESKEEKEKKENSLNEQMKILL